MKRNVFVLVVEAPHAATHVYECGKNDFEPGARCVASWHMAAKRALALEQYGYDHITTTLAVAKKSLFGEYKILREMKRF